MAAMYELVEAFFLAPKYHLALELLLIVWIVWLIFIKSYKPKDSNIVLTEKEKEDLIAEWQPEPLVPETPEDHPLLKKRIVHGKPGKMVNVDGKDCLNVASLNFLGIVGNHRIEERAIQALRKYGVGSCGPRGFYGTVDVHLELEERLAKFMHVEEAIIYSYGFSTIASAIPAYSKRGDIIFADEGVSFAIQKGLQASRSKLIYFKHNDVNDLETKLELQAKEDKKNPKKAKVTRKFIVAEGLYMNHGDICPLPDLIKFKYRYKVRIFLEESLSVGVLGETGRGITEYYGCNVEDVDMITGSLEYSVGSIGGFACGKSYVIDHQRLSGVGYCFSASLPPMLAAGAIEALNVFEEDIAIFQRVQSKSEQLLKSLSSIPDVSVTGLPVSPVLHVRLRSSSGLPLEEQQSQLEDIVQHAQEHGVAFTTAKYLVEEEIRTPVPSIRVAVNVSLTDEEIHRVADVLKDSVEAVSSGMKSKSA